MWFYYATRRTRYINSSYLVGEPLINSVVLSVYAPEAMKRMEQRCFAIVI